MQQWLTISLGLGVLVLAVGGASWWRRSQPRELRVRLQTSRATPARLLLDVIDARTGEVRATAVVASEGACVLLVPRGDYRVVLRGTCAYDGHPVELDARWVRQVSLWRPGRFEVSFDLRGFAPTLDVRLEGSAGQVAYVELAGTSLSARVTLPGRWLVCAPAGVATVRVISERETREFKRTIDPGELAVEEIELAAVARRSRSTEVATPEVAPAARSASTPPAIELALDQSALPGPSPTLAGIGAPAATLLELTPPRQVLAGRYQLGERLGAGAAGVVYRGEDLRLEREIAVKVLGGAHRDDPAAMRQLADEARTLARLSHPGIVAVYDCVVSRAERCLVMEFVDGDSLEAMLARRGPMPIRPVLRIGDRAGRGAGLRPTGTACSHRDIKPANVLVGRSGAIKLGDFGIARVTADLLIAQTGVRGTPAYMAPEQVRGRDVDARSDIYGLGATLFAAACGAPPFVDGMVGFRKLHEPAPAPSSVVPSLPDGFDALIARCLALEPRDRFASAGELLDALRRLARRDHRRVAIGPVGVGGAVGACGARRSPPPPPSPMLNPTPEAGAATATATVRLLAQDRSMGGSSVEPVRSSRDAE
jgi:hypothetical protein